MIDAIIRWCLKNTFLVLLGIIALVGAGWWSMTHIPVDCLTTTRIAGQRQLGLPVVSLSGRPPPR